MSVTFPRGFLASGVAAGFKASGRLDLGLLVADGPAPAAAAGAFTTNAFPAAPVTVTAGHLSDGRARAVVVNSGQANAGTGAAGIEDARETAALVAEHLACRPEDVLVCSTGVIGPRVPLDTMRRSLPEGTAALSAAGGRAFAEAILTTDTRPKEAIAEAGTFRVGGCVKGAGMIGPRLAPARLATLLGFLTCDAPAEPALLEAIVADRVVPVWNAVTVDACPSTNDAILLLASGAAGDAPIAPGDPRADVLADAVESVARDLARQLVADAEGASRTLVVQVGGAADDEAARAVGLAVAASPLVKTALLGADPNPGRFLQAIGAAPAAFDPAAVHVLLGGEAVVRGGVVVDPVPAACERAMADPEVVLSVELGGGPGAATVFGCDLTEEYIRINARYRT